MQIYEYTLLTFPNWHTRTHGTREEGKHLNNERDTLLAHIASLHYEHGEGLSSIAEGIGRSVAMASRMLQEARDRELVEIRINYPLVRAGELEERLQSRNGVTSVHQFFEHGAMEAADRLDGFGSLCACVVEDELAGTDLIGVSWAIKSMAS